MNLLLATPTMHKLVTSGYAGTIAAVGQVCAKHKIHWAYETADTMFIVDARNKLVEKFLSNPDRTHLLFVDSDSELGFTAVEKIITCGHAFASLPFCMRQIDLRAMYEYKDQPTFENVLATALTWCVDLASNDQQVVDGWVQARRTGFGCVLLERRVLEGPTYVTSVDIVAGKASTVQTGKMTNWFDRMKDPNPPHDFLSEDMAFCERVKHIATPMLCVDQVTHHNGTFSFGARLLDDQRYFMKKLNV